MTQSSSAYTGRTVTLATVHGEELPVRDAFHHMLGAAVPVPHAFDADQLRTFSGEIAHALRSIGAARAKPRSTGRMRISMAPKTEKVPLIKKNSDHHNNY